MIVYFQVIVINLRGLCLY